MALGLVRIPRGACRFGLTRLHHLLYARRIEPTAGLEGFEKSKLTASQSKKRREIAAKMALVVALRGASSKTPSLALAALRNHAKTPSLRTVARNKTTMRVVGSRSSAEDPDALAARLAAQLAPEVAPTRSMAAVVVASPCSVATVTQHLVNELQLDAAVGFGSHREAFCCDGVYQCINHFSRSFSANG